METEEVPTRELTTDTPISGVDQTTEVVTDPELIAHLRQVNSDLQRELDEAKQRHVTEVTLIGETLAEEADEHELCSVYDAVINGLNRKLTVPLPEREVDVSVRLTGSVTFQFDRTVVVALPMGTSANSTQAVERAMGALRSLGLRHVAQNGTDMVITPRPTGLLGDL